MLVLQAGLVVLQRRSSALCCCHSLSPFSGTRGGLGAVNTLILITQVPSQNSVCIEEGKRSDVTMVTLLVLSATLEQLDLQRDLWTRWVLGVAKCREQPVRVRLGQLCPSCAGLRQNQENHRFPLAATQTDSIITWMLSSLEIQDLLGSEGSRPKLKEYFPRVMRAPTSRDGGCVLHSRVSRSSFLGEF